MTAKIFRFNQHKEVEFIDLFYNGDMKFDVLLYINNLPFILKNVFIEHIKKNKMKFNYESLLHYPNQNNSPDICPFCNKNFEHSTCKVLTDQKTEIFTYSISQKLFFPIMTYYYNDKDQKYFDKLASMEVESFEPLYFGLSENTYVQCIFKYKNELLLFQDLMNANNSDSLPLIFYYDSQRDELHLYIEYLLPENLIPLLSAVNKFMHKPNVQIFDTTGIGLLELYKNFIAKNI